MENSSDSLRSHVEHGEIFCPCVSRGGQSVGNDNSDTLKHSTGTHILPQVRVAVADRRLHGHLAQQCYQSRKKRSTLLSDNYRM